MKIITAAAMSKKANQKTPYYSLAVMLLEMLKTQKKRHEEELMISKKFSEGKDSMSELVSW